jgi:predicted RNase H-like nuclease (RuvC/YqgF family)
VTCEKWRNKLEEVQSKCKKLECDLEESSKKEKRVAIRHCREIQLLEKKVTEVEQRTGHLCEGDMLVTEQSLAALDKLSLPQDGM